ncbi:MAG TPA: hypothetical protein VI197_16550 [Polyangiaceae bacterium]
MYSTYDASSGHGAFAVDLGGDEQCTRWAIHGPGPVPDLVELHHDHVVQGLVPGPRELRLLVRPSLTRGLFGVGAGGTDRLPGFQDIAGQVALSPGGTRLAYRTQEGHIRVRDVWISAPWRTIAVAGDTHGS